METKDPALTKTPISSHETLNEMVTEHTANTVINNHASVAEHDEIKGTRTLQETVIGAGLIEDIESLDDNSIDSRIANSNTSERVVSERVNHQDVLATTGANDEWVEGDIITQDDIVNHDELEANTSVTNGTDTFDKNIVDNVHVNEGDNAARQPDRRDQQGGSAFDEGINEYTVGSEAPKSEGITEMNRYASVDNAQSRILNPDQKD
ncbi:hypothetical protein KPY62_12065 [Psychrobacter sp. TAE2020]|uniref:hypothetical protein n=1 Tax=Psychrobacter sp. TAE2020 TaxID=2846762 RepID=UPI001C1261CA|nr:hypothetical protein [Psychrobacter sp. TAE2020]MBU5617812.1 hypothetical protein [Psychrobacter sp. TAE2020]